MSEERDKSWRLYKNMLNKGNGMDSEETLKPGKNGSLCILARKNWPELNSLVLLSKKKFEAIVGS